MANAEGLMPKARDFAALRDLQHCPTRARIVGVDYIATKRRWAGTRRKGLVV